MMGGGGGDANRRTPAAVRVCFLQMIFLVTKLQCNEKSLFSNGRDAHVTKKRQG
jgi:hypothetical protein